MKSQDPSSADSDPLDALAEKLLQDLESSEDPLAVPRSGLDWIRNTLRSGGAEADPLIGELFQGKYRILRRIGKGGFGAVYEAVDERGAKNRVALKIQLPSFVPSPERRETFRKEAMRVTRLNHPNIVDWKSFDETPDGGSYFVMELLDGVELSLAISQQGAFEPERAQLLMLQILGALRAAHFLARGQSILHLDLKPKNILLLPEQDARPEMIKVIDFGIGQFLGDEAPAAALLAPAPPGAAPPVPAARPTQRGTITAVASGTSAAVAARAASFPFEISQAYTAEYASPEHCVHIEFSSGQDCEPQPLDGRSDLYSFGVLAYELLTGRLPYPQPVHRPAWLRIHQEAPIEPWGEDEARIPSALRHFVERCLEKNPDDRFADTRVALEQLERIVTPPIGKRLALAAVALVLVGIVIAQWLTPPGGRLALLEHGEELREHYHGPQSEPWIVHLQEASNAREIDADTPLRLSSAGGDELADWSLRSTGLPGEFEIAAPADFGETQRARRSFPRVRVEGVEDHWLSDPFELVWLGEDTTRTSLSIAGMPIEAHAAPLAIDPQGLALELQFPELLATDLDREQWNLTQAGLPLALQAIADRGAGALLSAKLDGLPEGPVALLLEGQDRSGAPHHYRVALDIQPGVLRPSVELQTENGAPPTLWDPSQQRSFFQGEAVELVLHTNRKSDVSCPALNFVSGRSAVGAGAALRIPLANWLAAQSPALDLKLELLFVDRVLRNSAASEERHRRQIVLDLRVLEVSHVTWSSVSNLEPDAFGEPALDVLFSDGQGPLELEAATQLAHDRFEIELSVNQGTAQPVSLAGAEGRLDIEPFLPRDADGLQEGEQLVRVATYVLDTRGQRLTLSALAVQEFRVLVDHSAPQLGAPTHTSDIVRGLGDRWQVEFPYPADSGAPIALDWQVRARAQTAILRRGVSLASGPPSGSQSFQISPLADDGPRRNLQDGRYTLRVKAFDRAGNQAVVGDYEVEVARAAPQLSVLEPGQEVLTSITPWPAPDGQLQPIVVEARDPNGVRSIECSVYRQAGGLLDSGGRHFRADPLKQSVGETQALWSWSFDPPPAWSQATDVMILLKATDQAGQVQIAPYGPLRLPRIRESYPNQLAGMWLIPGNPGAPYSFKGRASVLEENRCFTQAGLTPIWVAPGREKPGEAESAWNLELPLGALEPYYLAEREVTTGEMLEYLRDLKGGYLNRVYWRPGQVPRDDRRRELLALYESRPANTVATDIWHSEASAYSRYVGKRLPTLLELTFAIRGGPLLYRAMSWDVKAGAQAQPASPWHRVRGLSSGAEWTSSPVSLERREGLPLTPHRVATFLPGFQSQRRVAEPYWISGTPAGLLSLDGSDLRSDFAAVDVGDPQDWSDSRVGFRLAWSADVALEEERGEQLPAESKRGEDR